MDKALAKLDWSLIQAFLAVAETGSLSAAARALNASQPTLGRQIKALEGQLGVVLFQRVARGYDVTEKGAALIAPAKTMRDAMGQIALAAAGQEDDLRGTVRITASSAISFHHLPAIITDMRIAEPEIEIELVPSDESRNLLFREADIAVRMYRPTQLDLVTQHIGDIALGVFAAKDYIARKGVPTSAEDVLLHDFVGYDTNPLIRDGFQEAGLPVDQSFFKTRCDDQIVYWELVRAGSGIGFAQASAGQGDTDMVEIDLGFPLPTLPIWLTAHAAMRQTPRIRRVWDMLAKALKPLVA